MSEPNPFTNHVGPGPTPLRALTLYDAWARMVVTGDKTIEVRSRPLKYRGLLLIHEAQVRPSVPGAFVGVVDLYDCRPLTADDQWATCLPKMPAGRAWGLHLRDALRLPARIEWRGRQGLWKPERRPGGDPGELREVLADALGPWGRGVAAAAERAELRLIWRLGTWRVHPPGDPESRLRYRFTVSTPSTPSGSIGVLRTLEVHGSKHDGGRAHREFCKEKGLLIGKMGDGWLAAAKARRTVGVTGAERQVRAEAAALDMEVEREPGRGWMLRGADGHREMLPNLGDVAERLHQIKIGRETMGRITKKEVSEAAHAAGLKLSSVKNAEGEWVLTDPAGETVRADSSLASMLQHCRDHRAAAAGAAPKDQGSGVGFGAEVAAAAEAVGLTLREYEDGRWALVAGTGEVLCGSRSLVDLMQFCHNYRKTAPGYGRSAGVPIEHLAEATMQEAIGTAPPAPAVAVPMEPAAGSEGEVDRLYGDGADYDRDRITAEVRHHLNQGALAWLEAGRRLCWLKDREPHGEWLPLLKRIGIHDRTADRMMLAARKFLDGPNSTLVANLNSVTKIYELATQDDDDLAALRKGGTIAGATLDDIQRMTPTELRDTLRRERKEHKERVAAQRVRIQDKDAKIGRLEDVTDDLHRRLDDARNPGRLTPTQAGRELLIETARVGRGLEIALDNTTEVVRRLYQLSKAGKTVVEGHEMTPRALPQELVHVRAQLDAIATSAHRALGELDEQLSDPLVTAPPPPDHIDNDE